MQFSTENYKNIKIGDEECLLRTVYFNLSDLKGRPNVFEVTIYKKTPERFLFKKKRVFYRQYNMYDVDERLMASYTKACVDNYFNELSAKKADELLMSKGDISMKRFSQSFHETNYDRKLKLGE